MGNLFFPQLASGSLVQLPIRKTRLVRTLQNVLADGSSILYSDPSGSLLSWDLAYRELVVADLQALQAHFNSCVGPFHAFTFIDPTDNMLTSSADLTASVWMNESGLQIAAGAAAPTGGSGAFTLSNPGQVSCQISQLLSVPSNYQYCFSVYVRSPQSATILLRRSGSTTVADQTYAIGANWTRIISAGRLNDAGTMISVAVELSPGQEVQLYGPQLEPQLAPSRFRPTSGRGGVYPMAHWAIDQLPVIAEGPDLYSTAFSIETTI
jgi:hypothetical protein